MQQTDFSDEDEAECTIAQVLEAMGIFDRHTESEDHYILKTIDRFEPAVAALFENDHTEGRMLSGGIRALLKVYNYNDSISEKNVLGNDIRLAFVEFLIFNLKQMAREEKILNSFLWKYYTDEELSAVNCQIAAAIPKPLPDTCSRWLIAGMNNAEIIGWLKTVKNNAACFEFEGLLSLAANALPAQRWETVKEALLDGAMLA